MTRSAGPDLPGVGSCPGPPSGGISARSREDTMRHVLNCVSWTAALSAALMTAAVGSWHEVSIPNLAFRCVVAGLVILVLIRGGGELVWRTVLRSLAEHQLRQEEDRHERRRKESEERGVHRAEANDPVRKATGAAQGQEAGFMERDRSDEAGSGEKASTDRMAA